jgi:hypothetical protein
MRASRLIPAVALFLAASGGMAHAEGGYVGLGAGPGAGLGGNISRVFTTDDSMNARLAVGQRFGPLALEASLYGAGLIGDHEFSGFGTEYDTLTLGVDLKYYFSILATPLEIYPKIGLNRTWLTGGPDRYDYDGVGWDLGAGAQLSFDRVALWLDYTHQRTNLRDDNRALPNRNLDGRLNMLALGVSVFF